MRSKVKAISLISFLVLFSFGHVCFASQAVVSESIQKACQSADFLRTTQINENIERFAKLEQIIESGNLPNDSSYLSLEEVNESLLATKEEIQRQRQEPAGFVFITGSINENLTIKINFNCETSGFDTELHAFQDESASTQALFIKSFEVEENALGAPKLHFNFQDTFLNGKISSIALSFVALEDTVSIRLNDFERTLQHSYIYPLSEDTHSFVYSLQSILGISAD